MFFSPRFVYKTTKMLFLMSSDPEELLLLQMARKAKLSSAVFVMHLQINLHKQAHLLINPLENTQGSLFMTY